ncbi:MAG: hypothetical protein K2M07_08910 [Muribaculaceae bacterium]|nr:hypothetical protein [Muribaculaceae bacterium]
MRKVCYASPEYLFGVCGKHHEKFPDYATKGSTATNLSHREAITGTPE